MEGPISNAFAYLRVLVVDQDATHRDGIENSLRSIGFFDVVTAPNNDIAKYILKKVACDVAIIEAESDNKVLLEILSRGRHVNTLVIATSFDLNISNHGQEIPKGIDVLLAKPASPSQLLRTISGLLSAPSIRANSPSVPLRREPAAKTHLLDAWEGS